MSFHYQTRAVVAFGVILCGLVLATVFGLYCTAALAIRMAVGFVSCMHTAQTSIMLHVTPHESVHASTWASGVDAIFVNLGWHTGETMTSAQMCNPSVWNAKKLLLSTYTYTVDEKLVKRNFRVLSNVYHPDKTGQFANAHSFICLTKARDELIHGANRAPVDAFIHFFGGVTGRQKKFFWLLWILFGSSLLRHLFFSMGVLHRWLCVGLPPQNDTPAHTPTRACHTTTQIDTPEHTPTRPLRNTKPPVWFT